ncbi:hypothetical protein [Segatella copri]|uniref:hypothetical protein n=1 Tax=Segatella copri TaxID=165179 RepID=UPI0012921FDE|nr:hypothetical protein [Segatella copri]MQM89729.1 hypothetical protein [Segatella copri]MQM94808.1 hypothetical protein [Segatella copri]MQN03254.1 hypothetical protein [Segatella copri]MQO37038.1 hypothetical protein [Segatella copri]
MNFLDESGLKKLWTKIKASFDTALVISSKCEDNKLGKIIPFVTNHQVIKLDTESNNNVYDWFQKASKGGILEIFFIGIEGSSVTCLNNNKSYMRKMNLSSNGPFLDTVQFLNIQYNNYARLIKMDDDTLLVAEFVQNK